MDPGETAVDIYYRWNSGEERRVERLEDEVSIGHKGEAGVRFLRSAALMKEDRVKCLHLAGNRPLMRDDDGVHRWGKPDIPC